MTGARRRCAVLLIDHWFEREGDRFVSLSEPRPDTLARRYLDSFDKVLVLGRCRDTAPGTLLHGVDRDGGRVDLLVVTNRPGPVGALLALPRLVAALRRHRDAVVVLNGPGMFGSLAAPVALRHRPYGVEVVAFIEETLVTAGVRAPVPQISGWLTARAVRGAAAAAYVTTHALQERYPPGPGALVASYSSIELPADAVLSAPVARPRQDPVHLVMVGSLARRDKGVDVLLDAAARLHEMGRRFRLSIVGDGALMPEYRMAVHGTGLDEVVELVGRLEGPAAVRDVLDHADVYVQPSLSEGLPRALIEAMARGLPCVATAVGGVPEVLDPEWQVPPGDAAALADALARMIDHPAAAEAAGARNLEVARGYVLDVLKPRRDRFYRDLAEVSAPQGEGTAPVVVLHLFSHMGLGGAELRTVALLDHLDPDRVRLVFGTLSGEPDVLDEEICRRGSEVIPLKLGVLWPLRLRRVVRERGVSVVHAHQATASGLFLTVARLVGVHRRIAHFRSDGDNKTDTVRRRAYRWTMRWLLATFATDVVAVSPAALDFARLGPRARPRTAVIPSGLDTDELRRALETPPQPSLHDQVPGAVMLHVGRPQPEKNRPRAVSVLLACLERGLDVSLVVAGDIDEQQSAELREQAAAGGVHDRLLITGERSDVTAMVAEADVLLVTSTLEGLPGVVLEACALGTPCVSSDLPGVLWIAEELDGVWPVALASPDARWVDALESALQAATARVSPEVALKRVENSVFSMRRAVAAFETLWTRP